MSGGPVVVVGDVMTDVLAAFDGPLVPAGDTPASIALRPGGSGANTAAWLGHLRVPTIFVGRVGDDAFGRDAARALREAGVTPRLAMAGAAATGTVIVLVDAAGERTMLPDSGANAGLAPEHIPGDVLLPGGHLHLSGYTLLRPSTRPAALAALAAARRGRDDDARSMRCRPRPWPRRRRDVPAARERRGNGPRDPGRGRGPAAAPASPRRSRPRSCPASASW